MQTRYLWTREEKIERWGEGPWTDEPDRIEWEYDGVRCVIARAPMGALCGYVLVQEGHPWYGQSRSHSDVFCDVSAHGGITWTRGGEGDGAGAGGTDAFWYVGFDCGHPERDVVPEMDKVFAKQGITLYSAPESRFFPKPTYKHFRWVRTEVEKLAQQAIDAFEASSANH